MTKMKESGIDWIGQIPEEWEVSKLEQYVDIFGRIGFRGYTTNDIVKEGEGAISYSPSNIIDYSVIDNNNTYISWSKYDESPEIQIKTGDVLYVKTGSSYGKTGIVNKLSNKATINPQLVVLKPKKNTDSRLINYFLNSSVGKEQSELIVGGSTIPTITQESIKKMIFPKMSFEEQQKIADFLDKKTAHLDKVKSLLEEQIQKLKDYRASLIYETVTKGLDKTVPMKDSGIDWIGQVPEGWGAGKVKYFSQISAGATPDRSNSLFWNGNINWMSSGEVNQGIVKHTSETITDLALKKTSTKLLPNGTVMLALNGQGKTKGTAAVLAIESASNQSLASFIVNNKILNNMYLYYFFVANYYNIRGLKGEDRDGLNLQLVSNIVIPLFEIEEQQKIAYFLDKKTVQIDQLIQIKNKQIGNINKQRQTLIYDYVTGKRRGKEI
ncbi:hypothetical protein BSR14_08350 [Streptococcus salivarius]|uniref:restriction endonuclease subunit S n=1 Tax=Streptococcus salivarius TaxID=1304 RepID=UPI001318C38C|nr:restriction endonuclease subunit S [Streptococcus salivarius]MBT1028386.1 restriction endonuclease subunit S [Streptococcus salivarius]QGU79222.1 hypothetical protein BSR14_08350 [Streptococcus salivarius]QGU83235.1 hypothetical protein BSR20_08355 [Streptococcus salivarius]